jgi:hypothetical protein
MIVVVSGGYRDNTPAQKSDGLSQPALADRHDAPLLLEDGASRIAALLDRLAHPWYLLLISLTLYVPEDMFWHFLRTSLAPGTCSSSYHKEAEREGNCGCRAMPADWVPFGA